MTETAWRRWRRKMSERFRDDDGQIMLLSIAYGVVALALVLTVVSISAIYLERKQLLALADAVAAGAADAVDEDAYFGSDRGETPELPLTDASVQQAAKNTSRPPRRASSTSRASRSRRPPAPRTGRRRR